jgi:DNA-binding SARP family transcriptional activator
MRLLYQSGDRTGALRQYERCVNILAQELNVGPSESTLKLHAQILKENSGEIALQGNPDDALVNESPTSLPAALIALKKFQTMLSNLQSQLQQEIQSIEHGLSQPEPPTTPLPSVHSDRRQIKP